MAMVEPGERFTGPEQPRDLLRAAEERCLEAEQRCFRAERRRFEAERRREQVEVLLAEARRAGIKMEQIVAELRGLVGDLRRASGHDRGAAHVPVVTAESAKPAAPGDSREQMVDALSTAIARLRANVQAVEAAPRLEGAPRPASSTALRPASSAAPRATRSAAPRPAQPMPAASAVEPLPPRTAHRHSASWISRWRARRKQRR